jgi:hypothetical protein
LLAETPRFEVNLPVFYAASQGLGGSLLQRVRGKKKDASWQNGTSFWMHMR